MSAGSGTPADVLDKPGDQVGELGRLAVQTGIDRFQARKCEQIIKQRVEAFRMALDGLKEAVAILDWHVAVAVDERLDVALDDTERGAQFMGDIRDEILADALQLFLPRDIVQHEKRPGTAFTVKRCHEGPGNLKPDGTIALNELEVELRRSATGAYGLNVIKKSHAVQDEFKALVEDVLRARENRLKRLVGEEDAIAGIDDEHGFLKAAERGLELCQLAGPDALQVRDLSDEFIGRGTQTVPGAGRPSNGFPFAKQRLFFENSLMKATHCLPVVAELFQGDRETDAKGGSDQVEHASALRSAMR